MNRRLTPREQFKRRQAWREFKRDLPELMLVFATLFCFALIGVMLAWRG